MRRRWRGMRHALWLGLTVLGAWAGQSFLASSALAQVPIPLQEQIQIFRSLPPAQQQALIRELQGQLPPAQRDAIVQMLMQQQGGAMPAAQMPGGTLDPTATLPLGWPQGFDLTALNDPLKLQAEDTLVIEFSLREDADAPATEEDRLRRQAFLQRLSAGNPYQLDTGGYLYLPGVPAMALAGLDVFQVTTRIRAEPTLTDFDAVVTFLPLEPMGLAALEPFGYELFKPEQAPLGGVVSGEFAPATNVPVPVDYVVGPGDSVNVQLFGNQNAEYFLTVSREGTINFPQIGPINISGLSFNDVRDLINERVAEQMIGVRASVTLGELRSIQVFLLGDVERPGTYTISSLSTITSALFAGGGIKTIGSLRRIELRRAGEVATTLDLYDLLLRGDTRNDSRLQPGDAILVPPVGATVAVGGEVRRPAIYELRGERSVGELVTLAGGLKPTADRSALKLERIVPGRGVSVQEIDFAVPAGTSVPVQDGDVLRALPNLDQLERSVRLAGNVFQPGLYQWRPGMQLGDLLSGPDLVKPMSDLNYVLIRRERSPNVDTEVLSADLDALWRRAPGAQDLALEPRDTVYVFNLDTGRQQFIEPILRELRAQAPPRQPVPVVRIDGQVRASGSYPLEPGMRVSDLLRAGGGLSDAAYAIEAELTRYSVVSGEYRETALLNVNMSAILDGDQNADVVLEPYDFLNIRQVSLWREQETVAVLGEVVFPGTYTIRKGERLSSLIDRAGGLTDHAFAEGSVFTRIELQRRERELLDTLARRIENDLASLSLADPSAADALSIGQALLEQIRTAVATGRLVIRLDELLAGNAEMDIVLQPGDRLMVPEISQSVTVIGEVNYSTSHLYEPGLVRDQYIEKSGGLTQRAEDERIFVVRANGEVVAEGGSRWFARATGTAMRPGDTIVVPQDVDRVRPLLRWTSVTQVVYQLALAAAAVNSF